MQKFRFFGPYCEPWRPREVEYLRKIWNLLINFKRIFLGLLFIYFQTVFCIEFVNTKTLFSYNTLRGFDQVLVFFSRMEKKTREKFIKTEEKVW